MTDGLTIASLTDKIGSATGACRLVANHSSSGEPSDAFVQHVGWRSKNPGLRVFDSGGIGDPGGTGHMQTLRVVYRCAALAGEKIHRPCRSTGIRTSLRRRNQSVNGGLYLAKMGSPTGLSPRSRISDRSFFSFIS